MQEPLRCFSFGAFVPLKKKPDGKPKSSHPVKATIRQLNLIPSEALLGNKVQRPFPIASRDLECMVRYGGREEEPRGLVKVHVSLPDRSIPPKEWLGG